MAQKSETIPCIEGSPYGSLLSFRLWQSGNRRCVTVVTIFAKSLSLQEVRGRRMYGYAILSKKSVFRGILEFQEKIRKNRDCDRKKWGRFLGFWVKLSGFSNFFAKNLEKNAKFQTFFNFFAFFTNGMIVKYCLRNYRFGIKNELFYPCASPDLQ